MKKLFPILLFGLFLSISGCKKEVAELPKTSFSSAQGFLESLKPEKVVINSNTDSTITIDFDGLASLHLFKYDWYPDLRGKPLRIEATYYDKALEMFYGGIPTVSNGELLSSEGAFEVEFWVDGLPAHPRNFDVDFTVSGNVSQTMNLFGGEVADDGSFNWIEVVCGTGGGVLPDTVPYSCIYLDEGPPPVYSGTIRNLDYLWEANGGITYINCDDFPNTVSARTDVELRIENLTGELSGIVAGGLYFPELNGFMDIGNSNSAESHIVYNVPEELSCYAVVILTSNQTLYYAMEPITIESDLTVSLELSPISEIDLETALEQL